jgi:osmotically-inducible protein OsmY
MKLLALPCANQKTSASAQLPALAHEALERIRRSGYLALRDISCGGSDGVVFLDGCLPSYYLKQVAQEIAGGVEGARHVVNRIEVRARAEHARPGPTILGKRI